MRQSETQYTLVKRLLDRASEFRLASLGLLYRAILETASQKETRKSLT